MELQLMPIILGGKNLDENRRRSIFIGEKSKIKEYKTYHVMIISLYKAVRKTISKPFSSLRTRGRAILEQIHISE